MFVFRSIIACIFKVDHIAEFIAICKLLNTESANNNIRDLLLTLYDDVII